MSDSWQALEKMALLGTDRAKQLPPQADPNVTKLLAQLGSVHVTKKLLSAAAAVRLQEQVGWLPERDNGRLPTPLPISDKPILPDKALAQLDLIINGRYRNMLNEWVATLVQSNYRIPDAQLPQLLDLGKRHNHLRPSIMQIMGERGEWLAKKNINWAYAVTRNSSERARIWRSGQQIARVMVFRQLRHDDPDKARHMVMMTWPREHPRARGGFLTQFDVNLSQADEKFLEDTLASANQFMRKKVGIMLSKLPDSRYAQRMKARSLACVEWQKGRIGRKDTLHITLPDGLDEAMIRDGLQPRIKQHGMGEKATLFSTIVSNTPLATWTESWSISPNQFLKAVKEHEWERPIIHGLKIAIKRQENSEWADALLHLMSDQFTEYTLHDLLPLLTPARREPFALSMIHQQKYAHKTDNSNPISMVIKFYGSDWSDALAKEMLRYVRQEHIDRYNTPDNRKEALNDWKFRAALRDLGPHFPLNLYEYAQRTLNLKRIHNRVWYNASDEFLSILTFRKEMRETLQPPTSGR